EKLGAITAIVFAISMMLSVYSGCIFTQQRNESALNRAPSVGEVAYKACGARCRRKVTKPGAQTNSVTGVSLRGGRGSVARSWGRYCRQRNAAPRILRINLDLADQLLANLQFFANFVERHSLAAEAEPLL